MLRQVYRFKGKGTEAVTTINILWWVLEAEKWCLCIRSASN